MILAHFSIFRISNRRYHGCLGRHICVCALPPMEGRSNLLRQSMPAQRVGHNGDTITPNILKREKWRHQTKSQKYVIPIRLQFEYLSLALYIYVVVWQWTSVNQNKKNTPTTTRKYYCSLQYTTWFVLSYLQRYSTQLGTRNTCTGGHLIKVIHWKDKKVQFTFQRLHLQPLVFLCAYRTVKRPM